MRPKNSRCLKCFKCLVYFYLCLICLSGTCVAIFSNYLLIFRPENQISTPRAIILSFLIVQTLLTIATVTLGWISIKKKNIGLIKFAHISVFAMAVRGLSLIQKEPPSATMLFSIWFEFFKQGCDNCLTFAVFLAVTDIIQIAGCLWCFISLPEIHDEVVSCMNEKFSLASTSSDGFNDKWWNDVQRKFKCCGLYGPTDYATTKAVPLSCCGSLSDDPKYGPCSFIWQTGCVTPLTNEVSQDIIILGLIGLGLAFIQIPGVFIAWCFAKRMSKEML